MLSQVSFAKAFAKPRDITCSEFVWKAFQEEKKFTEEEIMSVAKFGRGKAPGNICGALYAGAMLVKPEFKDKMYEEFGKVAGAVKCKEIKKLDKLQCPGCKALAIELIKKFNK